MLLTSSAPRLGVLLTPHRAHISPSPRTSAEAEGPEEVKALSVMIRVWNLPFFTWFSNTEFPGDAKSMKI